MMNDIGSNQVAIKFLDIVYQYSKLGHSKAAELSKIP
jgi:hypothetical protein